MTSFLTENKIFRHKIILAVFIIAMLGPWAFDKLNVPAQYPCSPPSIRLYGDYCGYPMTGFGALLWTAGFIPYILADVKIGNLAVRIPELKTLILTWITILPFCSTLLLVWNTNSRRLQIVNMFTWCLACVSILIMLMVPISQTIHAWGRWLYLVLAVMSCIIEIFLLRPERKTEMHDI